MRRTKVRRVRRQGFTLIELLIVLAILVGLMALVAPRLLGSRQKAEINTAKTQIGLFRGALDKYEFDTRGLPGTEQGLAALTAMPAASDETGTASTGWDGPYLENVPNDPWGMPYQYEYPPTRGGGTRPDIWSYGPDRADGTADDICSWTTAGGGVDEEGNPIEEPKEPGMDPMGQGPPMPPMDAPTPRGGMPGPPALPSAGGPPPLPPSMPAQPSRSAQPSRPTLPPTR